MKPEEKNIDEAVKRYWSSPSHEEAQADCDRVLHHLRTAAEHGPQEHRAGSRFLPFFGTRLAMVPAAAAVLLAVFLGATITQQRSFAVIEKSGATVAAGEVVRAEGDGSTLVLTDGSRVEMRAQAELVLERANDGVRIRLNKGDVIVSAAKQHGHLYVQTRDLKVSVVGTVFLVKADDRGSRVAVVEGQVRVQQGTVEKSLRPGEQVASNPKSPALEADRQFLLETGWSREAYASLAKLQESMAQSLAARQTQGRAVSVSDKPKFEEASIRPCEKDLPAEGRGGGGAGSSIRLSPGRVDVRCMTVPTLITMAHRPLKNNLPPPGPVNLPMNVPVGYLDEDGTRVKGGPDWVRSDKYTIEAVGDSTDGPTLQGPMLLDLLERRFDLKLRVETEEIPVYAITIAKGGLKIKPLEIDSVKYEELRKIRASLPPQRGPASLVIRDLTYASLLGCSYAPLAGDPNSRGAAVESDRFREALLRDGQPPVCGFEKYTNGPNRVIRSGGSPISLLIHELNGGNVRMSFLPDTLNGLLVADKTGLPDTNCLIDIPSAGTPCAPLFNYFLEYAIDESFLTTYGMGAALSLPKAPNIFKALEKLGLHLEKSKAPREYIFIEHIERLSPN
jgi:uncharacterized protein (TIGR03435 family)